MPDWSYRTVLRPLMLSLGPERARRLAVFTLGMLSRHRFGLAAIDFMGHMRADSRLRTRVDSTELAGPIAIGALIDPAAEALAAFSRFGAGLIEVGPVAERATEGTIAWKVDLKTGVVGAEGRLHNVGVASVAEKMEKVSRSIPVCVRIAAGDTASIRRIIGQLGRHAAFWSVEAGDVDAALGDCPVLVRIRADDAEAENLARTTMDAGAAGVWIHGEAARAAALTRSLRLTLPDRAIIVAGGVNEPHDARQLLSAGANVAVVDAGLISSGPGLVKRCNEALLAEMPVPAEPEPLSLDAARRSWFWALLLGTAMFGGGLLALVIASTRVVLPYDESLCGMTRDQLASINPRLLPFMAHDRVSLAGTMLSVGLFYIALAWFGIRRGAHWAQVTVIASATIGFFSFFLFLGFGYFDPFHAFVTAILTQFTVLCMVTQPSPPQPLQPEWRETAAWRRGQW
ncbi:MAG: hypothetical protein JJE51_14035, partial [Thermoanaerobaculia bacterium]|nr:hypothetical protein [Thermoanaerobaculia bacterium]